jgi:glucosamine--fructose-6-phosphate aminotransferase (isomerizing)
MSDSQFATLAEIQAQAAAWRDVLADLAAKTQSVRSAAPQVAGAEIILMGCGSPYYLLQSAESVYRGAWGLNAYALPGSELIFYPETALAEGAPSALIVASRSGETTEVLRAVESFRKRSSGPVFAVTCYAGSALDRMADVTVIAEAAIEVSLAQTRSFTSMYLGVLGIGALLAGGPVPDVYGMLPALVDPLIAAHHDLARALGEEINLERLFYLGSGPLHGLAREAMLKMKEMALTYSEAYHVLEFRHGPMAMVNDRSLVVGMLSERALVHEAAVLGEMKARGATVLAVTPERLPEGLATHQVVLPAGLSDWERGALYLPVPQMLAYYRSVIKGLNPDEPRNLTAYVTLDMA